MVALLGVALMAVGCAVGCTSAVGGKALAARRFRSKSLSGQAITQVLLNDRALSQILNQPFVIDARLPPQFGGAEMLTDLGTATPANCLGVAEMLHQSVYRAGQVGDVAVEAWRHAAVSKMVTSVKEGVVSLPTPADAEALFARFSQQWQNCEGQVAELPDEVLRLKAKISNVQVAPAVLAATVSIAFAAGSDTGAIPAGRALGVRGNCLVEVEVDYFNTSTGSLHGSANAIPTVIAQAMMGRVSELS